MTDLTKEQVAAIHTVEITNWQVVWIAVTKTSLGRILSPEGQDVVAANHYFKLQP